MKVYELMDLCRISCSIEFRENNFKVAIVDSGSNPGMKLFDNRIIDDWFPIDMGGLCINLESEAKE